jgi:uracil-DNA glycosylase family 4
VTIEAIETRVVSCERCPELRAYCKRIADEKKRAYRDQPYWGKPVPAFGDPQARMLLVGLAPGAHGSNRTGRMFTGDASGVWLYRALYRAGFANQPMQQSRDDGMQLHDCLITAAVRCAPPKNKPTPQEMKNCAPYLVDEIAALPALRLIIGLGAIGTTAAAKAATAQGYDFKPLQKFAHAAESQATHPTRPPLTLLATYHPSQQNTNTGVLTQPMLDAIFTRARHLLTPS